MPGEWRCLKAASLGEGKFEEASSVVAFVKCKCPGRSLAPNTGMAMKLSEIKGGLYLRLSDGAFGSCRKIRYVPRSRRRDSINEHR